MAVNWLRRSVLTAACASVALLAACGSSTIESALKPERFIAFGDGFSDVGQVGGARYTVNDGSVNNWTEQLAATYGLALKSVSAGGTSYAQGNARVSAKPDAAGNASTPTVTQQVDAFLASGGIKENDVVLLGAGTADVIAEMAAVTAGTQTPDQMLSHLKDAGTALGAQAERLVQAGAKHVLVVNTYNLGRSPWATAIGQANGGLLTQASRQFNIALTIRLHPLGGANVHLVDTEGYFNLVIGPPVSSGFNDATNAVCTLRDANNGIGIGTGEVNSALCKTTDVISADYNKYVFADTVYFTPQAHRLFGTYVYDSLRRVW